MRLDLYVLKFKTHEVLKMVLLTAVAVNLAAYVYS